jgi:hypothetical protein
VRWQARALQMPSTPSPKMPTGGTTTRRVRTQAGRTTRTTVPPVGIFGDGVDGICNALACHRTGHGADDRAYCGADRSAHAAHGSAGRRTSRDAAGGTANHCADAGCNRAARGVAAVDVFRRPALQFVHESLLGWLRELRGYHCRWAHRGAGNASVCGTTRSRGHPSGGLAVGVFLMVT